jgi:hypothetical protein
MADLTRVEAMLEVLSMRCAQEGTEIGSEELLELFLLLDEAESMIGARVQLGAATEIEQDWIARLRARLDIDMFLADDGDDEDDGGCEMDE